MTVHRLRDFDIFGFAIEVTGVDENGTVKGNVFEVGNYAEFANHIRHIAEPLESVTLIYSDGLGVNAGKTINVSQQEYVCERPNLINESGTVAEKVYHPQDKLRLAGLITQERSNRMALPIGRTSELVQKVSDKLTEVRKPPEKSEQVAHADKSKQAVPDRLKPKTLAGKLQAANEKVKAQDAQANNKKLQRREERN